MLIKVIIYVQLILLAFKNVKNIIVFFLKAL